MRWFALALLGACQNPDAKYAEAIGKCELEVTCAKAVECRRLAAEEAHRPFSGHCVMYGDGGAE